MFFYLVRTFAVVSLVVLTSSSSTEVSFGSKPGKTLHAVSLATRPLRSRAHSVATAMVRTAACVRPAFQTRFGEIMLEIIDSTSAVKVSLPLKNTCQHRGIPAVVRATAAGVPPFREVHDNIIALSKSLTAWLYSEYLIPLSLRFECTTFY